MNALVKRLDREYGWLYTARRHESRYTYFISMSVFRVLFGIYILLDYLINILPWFKDLFSVDGVVPPATVYALNRGYTIFFMPWVWSLHSDVVLNAVMVVMPLAAVLFIIGYHTRVATFALMVGTMFFAAQNPAATYGGPSLVIMLLLWSLFCPLARYFSIEAVFNRRLAPDRPYPVLPIWLLHGQISIMYLIAAFYKLASVSWVNGSAVKAVLISNVYAGSRLDWWTITHFGGMLPLVTWGILALQLAFPFLVHSPWHNTYTRALAFFGGLIMHTGFLVLMNVGGLPYLCAIYLTLIVPDGWWKAVGKRLPKLARPRQIAKNFEGWPRSMAETMPVWAVGVACGLFLFSMMPVLKNFPALVLQGSGFGQVIDSIDNDRSIRVPDWTWKGNKWLGLRQPWTFFAPRIAKHNQSYELTGLTTDGLKVDLWSRWKRNPMTVDTRVEKTYFETHHWLRYFTAINNRYVSGAMQRDAFLRYLCRQVNGDGQEPVRFISYTVYQLDRDLETGLVKGRRISISQQKTCE